MFQKIQIAKQDTFKAMSRTLQANTRLDLFLYSVFDSKVSRNKVQQLIKQGIVYTENGRLLNKPNFKSKQAIKLNFILPNKSQTPNNKKIYLTSHVSVLFENQHFAILHKPHGLSVHPSQNSNQETLVDFLKQRFSTLSTGFRYDRPGIIHRLDKDTEGVLLITKTDQAQVLFIKLFKERKIYKSYLCYHWGILQYHNQLFQGYIQRNSIKRTKMHFSQKAIHLSSKISALILHTLQTQLFLSKTKIQLITGRKHQIRAFLASLDKPIIGDPLYGYSSKRIQQILKQYQQPLSFYKEIEEDKMLLFAQKMGFIDPIEHVERNFEIPTFARLNTFEQKLEKLDL